VNTVIRIRAGRPGLYSRQGQGILLFSTAVFRQSLGPNKPSKQWVMWALFPGIKRPGREADHSPPSSPEVKKA
jgi:hypothetical protein